MFKWPQKQLGQAELHEATCWGYDIRIVRCRFRCLYVPCISLDMNDTLLQYDLPASAVSTDECGSWAETLDEYELPLFTLAVASHEGHLSVWHGN